MAALPHEDISPTQENFYQIPGWPATYKASVEKTPSYFPRQGYLATIGGNEPVFGKTALMALKKGIRLAQTNRRSGNKSVPTREQLMKASGRPNKRSYKNPVTVNGDTYEATYYHQNTSGITRHKPVPYPEPTAQLFVPYTDSVSTDIHQGSDRYDYHESHNHYIDMYDCELVQPALPTTAFEMPHYGPLGSDVWAIIMEYADCDPYEGHYNLERPICSFDNEAHAREAAWLNAAHAGRGGGFSPTCRFHVKKLKVR